MQQQLNSTDFFGYEHSQLSSSSKGVRVSAANAAEAHLRTNSSCSVGKRFRMSMAVPAAFACTGTIVNSTA